MSTNLPTIEDLLDRVKSDPNPNNWIVLSDWIGTLDLKSGADAIVDWAYVIRDRAIEIECWLKPLRPIDLIEPSYNLAIFEDLVLGRMNWDLESLIETFDRYYPDDRQSSERIDRNTDLVIDDSISDPLAVAHDENIELWVNQIVELVRHSPQSLKALAKSKPLVQIWLSVLLSNSQLVITRESGDFYDPDGLVVKYQNQAEPNNFSEK